MRAIRSISQGLGMPSPVSSPLKIFCGWDFFLMSLLVSSNIFGFTKQKPSKGPFASFCFELILLQDFLCQSNARPRYAGDGKAGAGRIPSHRQCGGDRS